MWPMAYGVGLMFVAAQYLDLPLTSPDSISPFATASRAQRRRLSFGFDVLGVVAPIELFAKRSPWRRNAFQNHCPERAPISRGARLQPKGVHEN